MDTSERREVDNLRQRRNRTTSSRATRVLSHRRVRLFATFASLSHSACQLAALRDDDGISPRLHARPLGHPSLLKNPEEGGGWMYWMCWMCWMGRRRQGLEEYVPLPYSPPSSACRLVPGTPVAPFARRARIPAQEFGRWTTSPLRNSIARLKSTPLCAIPLPLSPARIRCCSSRRRGRYATHERIPAQEFDPRYL